MKISNFTAEERAEIEAAVVDAYTGPDGETLTHGEAVERFDRVVDDAVQAHRSWAPQLLDVCRYEGMRSFCRETWKRSEHFQFRWGERVRSRTTRRGRQRADESGEQVWVQEELFSWDGDALKDAIAKAVGQIEEHRANIALYRRLLDLIEETDAVTVGDGLDSIGMSLAEYLEERAA